MSSNELTIALKERALCNGTERICYNLAPMREAFSKILLPLFCCIMHWLAVPAIAGDFLIVPGQRIGSIALGQSPQSVHRMLHRPQLIRSLPGGVVEESWVSRLSKAQQRSYQHDGRYWKMCFVNIYFRQGQVVQIEVNSPQFYMVGGLSTNSAAIRFERHFRPYHSSNRKKMGPLLYGTLDQEGGFPGYKHYVTIEDATQSGLAWRYGSWGDLAPDPNPAVQEVIIVHRRGQCAILEPDAGNRFVLTERDVEHEKGQ